MSATTTDASDPFSPTSNETNPPDVIVRSSDMVDFHSHKAILSFGSPVFSDMFSFSEPAGEDARDGKPVVALPESRQTVEKLLVLCYPRYTSSYLFPDLDGVDAAYESVRKYQIQGGEEFLQHVLEDPRFLEKEPHRVFAIACHRGLATLAKSAAKVSLRMPRYIPNMSVPEYRLISAHRLRQLEDFHYRCSQAVARLIKKLVYRVDLEEEEGLPDDDHSAVWWDLQNHSAGCGPSIIGETILLPATWFKEHMARVEESATLCPDPELVAKDVAQVKGLTLKAVSGCSKCTRELWPDLWAAAADMKGKMLQKNAKVLDTFSFVD
ncbi:hypothetical protein C8R43DRAFT_521121 [Mycena crocata]|nr:hypothetical protein C8R43DRAFT_521121 [Mycena crocata]